MEQEDGVKWVWTARSRVILRIFVVSRQTLIPLSQEAPFMTLWLSLHSCLHPKKAPKQARRRSRKQEALCRLSNRFHWPEDGGHSLLFIQAHRSLRTTPFWSDFQPRRRPIPDAGTSLGAFNLLVLFDSGRSCVGAGYKTTGNNE